MTGFGTTGRKESRVTQSPGQEPGGGWAGEADLGASTERSQPAPGTGPLPGGKEPRGRAGGQGCSGEDPGRAQEEKRSSRGKEPTSPPGKPGKQRKDDVARRGWGGGPGPHRGLLIFGHILLHNIQATTHPIHNPYFPFFAIPAPCLFLHGGPATGRGGE